MGITGSTKGGFKAQIATLEREIPKKKKELERLTGLEVRARDRWTKGYHAFLKAAGRLANLKVHNTKTEAGLKKKIDCWPAESGTLTRERDAVRIQVKKAEQELAALGTKMATLREQESNEIGTTNEIVTQVFALNDAVVRAATDREECLKRHVFPRLIDEQGNLRRQLSFTSSNGLQRVVAMVNTLTIVRGDLASQAKGEIEQFFERFQRTTKMDEGVRPLYDLTRELLVEKTDFKVRPDLYRFLAMDLDGEIFPELSRAQTLLRQSIRSEKTTSYIRLYLRESRASKWEVVPQS